MFAFLTKTLPDLGRVFLVSRRYANPVSVACWCLVPGARRASGPSNSKCRNWRHFYSFLPLFSFSSRNSSRSAPCNQCKRRMLVKARPASATAQLPAACPEPVSWRGRSTPPSQAHGRPQSQVPKLRPSSFRNSQSDERSVSLFSPQLAPPNCVWPPHSSLPFSFSRPLSPSVVDIGSNRWCPASPVSPSHPPPSRCIVCQQSAAPATSANRSLQSTSHSSLHTTHPTSNSERPLLGDCSLHVNLPPRLDNSGPSLFSPSPRPDI